MRKSGAILLPAALLLVLPSSSNAFAQSKPATPAAKGASVPAGLVLKTYHGEYEGGRATYTYYLDEDGQRVRHGHFELVKKVSVFVDSRYTIVVPDRERRTAGTYAHGQRTGRWTVTETTYARFGGRATDIENRTVTTETYAHGQLDGPATYADVPWRAGKPGIPTISASAWRRTRPEIRTLAVRRQSSFRRDEEAESAGRDTTLHVTEYAAGPFRYDTEPDASDPARRPQTVRGYFDANGYCDSTWTLRYYKGGSEGRANMYGRVFTAVERAGGWMTTILTFDHGVLRRERTTQASTGALISKFALPASQPYDSVSRLVLLGSPAHLYGWSIGSDHPDEPDWHSPIPETEDASGAFFREAAKLLGPPLLLDVSFRLAPTAADSALLHQSETVLATAHAQWLGLRSSGAIARPAADTTGAAFRELYLHLYDLLAVRQVGVADDESDDEPEDNSRAFRGLSSSSDTDGRDVTNPYPWLRALVGNQEAGEEEPPAADEADTVSAAALVAHLQKIERSLAQVQARLSAGPLPAAPAESPAVTP